MAGLLARIYWAEGLALRAEEMKRLALNLKDKGRDERVREQRLSATEMGGGEAMETVMEAAQAEGAMEEAMEEEDGEGEGEDEDEEAMDAEAEAQAAQAVQAAQATGETFVSQKWVGVVKVAKDVSAPAAYAPSAATPSTGIAPSTFTPPSTVTSPSTTTPPSTSGSGGRRRRRNRKSRWL